MNAKRKSRLTDERNSFKPFNYPWAYDAWLKHEQSHWLHTEVPMLEDVKDWKSKLNNQEKQFLTNILRFFTQGLLVFQTYPLCSYDFPLQPQQPKLRHGKRQLQFHLQGA